MCFLLPFRLQQADILRSTKNNTKVCVLIAAVSYLLKIELPLDFYHREIAHRLLVL